MCVCVCVYVPHLYEVCVCGCECNVGVVWTPGIYVSGSTWGLDTTLVVVSLIGTTT